MFSNDPFIDIHTHQTPSNSEVKAIVCTDYTQKPTAGSLCSFGIHPWRISDHPLNDALPLLMSAFSAPEAIAVGEAGLDRVIGTAFDLQEKYFKAQITISEYFKKPMILHCVKAFSDIQEIRKAGKSKMPWVIHGFNANKQTADQLIKMNFYLSFGKDLLDSESKAAQIFPLIPIKSIFLETDASGLDIRDIYEQAAKLRKITVEQLRKKIAENANSCFK